MGLLRVPSGEELRPPILSYHHGDPEHFRGRPAGFYEMEQGRRTMGQVVQILSNSLDAGAVVASAETKVHPHSYRATLTEAYRHSPLLLSKAIDRAIAATYVATQPTGHNYRLPGNARVLRFMAARAIHALRRMLYGAFFEKRWQIARTERSFSELLDPDGARQPSFAPCSILPVPEGYRFLADPFFHPGDSGLVVEALRKTSDKGEILLMRSGGSAMVLCPPDRHHSYPAVAVEAGMHYLLPETSDWSSQLAYPLTGGPPAEPVPLRIEGNPRLLDPTPFRCKDGLFLFANDVTEGSSVLRLWTATSLFEPFVQHPASPIRISPIGARLAGGIVEWEGRLFRLGQDFSGAYGDGIVLFRIEQLSRRLYREALVGSGRFDQVRGPHTVNFDGNRAVFDFYRDRFSALAGLRRLRQSR
jgi:hypothetical protein